MSTPFANELVSYQTVLQAFGTNNHMETRSFTPHIVLTSTEDHIRISGGKLEFGIDHNPEASYCTCIYFDGRG